MPDLDNMDDMDDSGGDSDLEAELAAITAGETKRKPKPQKPKTVVAPSELDRMVAESLRDVSEDELSGDDDDPDLLSELADITGNEVQPDSSTPPEQLSIDEPVQPVETPKADAPILPTTTESTVDIIRGRLEMYKLAEKVAKEAGESTKARSRGRGIKTLESLLKQALAGKTINPDDIPPAVSVKAPNAPAEIPASPPAAQTTPEEVAPPLPEPATAPEVAAPIVADVKPAAAPNEATINALLARQREYKVAALTSKKAGDTAAALQYVKIIKVFDAVLASARNGEQVDLSDMPPAPSELSSDLLKAVGNAPAAQTDAKEQPPPPPPKEENTVQQSTDDPPAQPAAPVPDLPPPETPKTILEALTQRLQKYQSLEAKAKAEGNDRKARQNGRIIKQYQDAVRMHKAGKAVAFDELPVPPGYPPIPTSDQRPTATPKPTPAPSSSPPADTPSTNSSPEKKSPSRPPLKKQDSRISGNHSNTSVMNKTIEVLLQRQKEFKEAALEAKKAGELEQAKEYLKTFKGIESLLNVAKGGLPVDLSTVSTDEDV